MTATFATVYIPTLKGGERLAACLESLQRQTVPVQVVVADNGPGQGCQELIATRFPDVIRIGFGRNLGFGPALNRAIAKAGEGAIILLNDDAVADPGFAEALLEASSDAEMVAAVLVSERDPSRIDSAGVIVDQTLMAFDHLRGQGLDSLASARDPVGPTGGAALYSRSAFEKVGGFDERIFLYYEDVDLALRMRSHGYRCRLAPQARVVHAYSETLGAGSAAKHGMTGWSRGYLLRRYGILRNPATAAGAIVRELGICGGQIVQGRSAAGLKGRLKGWRQARGLERHSIDEQVITKISAWRALSLRKAHQEM